MLSVLPDEIILEISTYLNEEDFISLSNTNARLLTLLASEKRTLSLNSCYNIDVDSIQVFIKFSKNLEVITHLNLNDCYWLDADFLSSAVISLSSSLHKLSVRGTKLNSQHLVALLKTCPHLVGLSASFNGSDSTFWNKADVSTTYPSDCIFEVIRENLSQLVELELQGEAATFHMNTIFLSFCPNLESLSLLELSSVVGGGVADRGLNLRRVELWVEELLPYLPSFPFLRRLLCRSNAVGDLSAHSFLYYLVSRILSLETRPLRDETSVIDVLWFPHVCVDDFLHRVCPEPKALHITYDTIEFLEYYHQHVEDLCVDSWYNAVEHDDFMRSLNTKLPNLKTISFAYDSEHFYKFARNHRNIRVLQLQTSVTPPSPNFPEELGSLKKLTKFSVDPGFFYSATFNGEEEDYETSSFELVIEHLVNGCIWLKEIEIGIFPTPRCDNPITEVQSDCLSMFSRCASLERLTLANLKVDKLNFVSSILAGCSHLKSLRLTNLKNEFLVSSMVKELEKGLPLTKQLHDFRLELGQSGRGKFVLGRKPTQVDNERNKVGPDLIATLKKCNSLRRIAIIADYKVFFDLGNETVHWPNLIFGCIISPTVDWIHSGFRITSQHPAYQCFLGPSKVEAAIELPTIHFNQMVLFDSEVTKMPFCY